MCDMTQKVHAHVNFSLVILPEKNGDFLGSFSNFAPDELAALDKRVSLCA